MVLANHKFPPDIRVEKEALALTRAGHEVFLLCRRERGQEAVERVGDITVVRHRVYPGNSLRRRIDSATFLMTLDSPSWRNAMVGMVREHGVEALHMHDLPYARSGIRAARIAGVPFVLDLHENHPAAFRFWKRRPIEKLMFSPERAQHLEDEAVCDADAVVVVVDEARERLVERGAIERDVIVFGNVEPLELAGDAALPLPDGPLRMVYVGGLNYHRGLDIAIDAMPAILREQPDARLTIVGDGDVLEDLKSQAAEMELGESVRFTGWLSRDEAMDYVREANLALVPHRRSGHTDATVPHKLFQYMALGRPVLVSDCLPLQRIVDGAGSGKVFASGDAADFARQALALGDHRTALIAGGAGRRAVLERWNLEAESPGLIGLYDRLSTSWSPKSA